MSFKQDLRKWISDNKINKMRPYQMVRKILRYLRVTRPVTAILGRQYPRSRRFIEIDITYRCNLNCLNCNRSCRQAPTSETMTVEQIAKFIDESIAKNQMWERIRLLGGEPTLHPQLSEILKILFDYRDKHNPKCHLMLTTNGTGKKVNSVLATMPEGIEIENTAKMTADQDFSLFNEAPRDYFGFRSTDFTNGCAATTWCGMALTPYGYYHCAVAGGIDRIFGYDIGRKSLPDNDDDMLDQFVVCCGMCGHFMYIPYTQEETKSPLWAEGYAKWEKKPPELTLY